MVDYKDHAKHGMETYVNQNVKEQHINPDTRNEHSIGIYVGNLTIYNVYRPPSERWYNSVLPVKKNLQFISVTLIHIAPSGGT